MTAHGEDQQQVTGTHGAEVSNHGEEGREPLPIHNRHDDQPRSVTHGFGAFPHRSYRTFYTPILILNHW